MGGRGLNSSPAASVFPGFLQCTPPPTVGPVILLLL